MACPFRRHQLQSDCFGNLRHLSSSALYGNSLWELLVSRSIRVCDREKGIALIQFVTGVRCLLCPGPRRPDCIHCRRGFNGDIGHQIDTVISVVDFPAAKFRDGGVRLVHLFCETRFIYKTTWSDWRIRPLARDRVCSLYMHVWLLLLCVKQLEFNTSNQFFTLLRWCLDQN